MKFKSIVTSLLTCLFIISNLFITKAQSDVEMADSMRANGKIYVVVSVVTIVLCGLFIYLMTIDKRLRKIEKGKGKN